jgi:hypothetical protein
LVKFIYLFISFIGHNIVEIFTSYKSKGDSTNGTPTTRPTGLYLSTKPPTNSGPLNLSPNKKKKNNKKSFSHALVFGMIEE